jgi:hypothetical protein
MRKRLLSTVLAASALAVGMSAGALHASDPATPDPANTPTTTNPLDFLTSLGLTNEQIGCLVTNGADLDSEDISQVLDLMSQCGIDLMDVMTHMGDSGETTTTAAASALDPADVLAVLAMLGITPPDAECVATGIQTTAGSDDEAALIVLQGCGISLDTLLRALVQVNAQASGAKPEDATTPTAVAVPTTAVAPSGEPMVDLIQQMLADMGITLTNEQVSCIVETLGDGDPSDMTLMQSILSQCGITFG